MLLHRPRHGHHWTCVIERSSTLKVQVFVLNHDSRDPGPAHQENIVKRWTFWSGLTGSMAWSNRAFTTFTEIARIGGNHPRSCIHWLVVWNMAFMTFHVSWECECHHPNRLSLHHFSEGVAKNHQPVQHFGGHLGVNSSRTKVDKKWNEFAGELSSYQPRVTGTDKNLSWFLKKTPNISMVWNGSDHSRSRFSPDLMAITWGIRSYPFLGTAFFRSTQLSQDLWKRWKRKSKTCTASTTTSPKADEICLEHSFFLSLRITAIFIAMQFLKMSNHDE